METKDKTVSAELTSTETPKEKTIAVSVELTSAQYAFLTGWQKTHEEELGIEVPISALVRKTVDAAMKAGQRPPREEGFAPRGDRPSRPPFGGGDRGGRPSFGGGDRPSRPPFGGGDRGGRPSFGGGDRGRPSGGRPSFGGGGRPSFGGGDRARGPKFDMLSDRKPRRFDDK